MIASSPQPALIALVLAGMLASALTPAVAQVLPSTPPEALVLTEADNGKTATAVVEQPIAVNLQGNPTTVVTIHVVTGDVLPRLSIALVDANVVIQWPTANSEGFYLEGATRLQPANWTALNVLPLPEGDYYQVTLGTSDEMLLFRLRK